MAVLIVYSPLILCKGPQHGQNEYVTPLKSEQLSFQGVSVENAHYVILVSSSIHLPQIILSQLPS